MSSIKLVVTDIDGTIAQHAQSVVSDAVRETIIQLEVSGVTVAPVSGRSYSMTKQLLHLLAIEGPCVMDNGATIYDTRTDEILWQRWIPAETSQAILERILPFCTEAIYVEGHTMVPAAYIDPEEAIDTPSIFALTTPEMEPGFMAELANMEGLYYYFLEGVHPVTGEHHRAVQITHHEATKQHGVEVLQDMLDVKKHQTLAIGDGDNDIALFNTADITVAMGNATPSLAKIASHSTASVDDDGFVLAMRHHILTNTV